MKKTFVALFCLSLLATPAFALTRGWIRLSKPISGFYPGTSIVPKTQPLDAFTAFQNLDEIVITSELVSGQVSVSIYDANGAVIESVTEYVSVGGEISISLASLPAGAYILEVSYDETIYVGQFEI